MVPLDIRSYRKQAQACNEDLPRIFPEFNRQSFNERATLETEAGQIEIDVYVPSGEAGRPLPIYFNLHGGGFCLGFREPDDPFCRVIAEGARCLVVNADYPISPESKFPEAIERVYALMKWFSEHASEKGVDRLHMAIGGQSAGGGLAAAVSLLGARRREYKIATQVLLYPYLDLATPPSEHDWGEVSAMEREDLVNVFENYVGWYLRTPSQAADCLASPVLTTVEEAATLPPTLLLVAGRDGLAAEADRYAQLLMSAGVELRYRRFPESIHGFTHLEPASEARQAWALVIRHLKDIFWAD